MLRFSIKIINGPSLACGWVTTCQVNDVFFAKTWRIWYQWKALWKCERMVLLSCWYSKHISSYSSFKFGNLYINFKFWVYFAVVLIMCIDLSSWVTNPYKTVYIRYKSEDPELFQLVASFAGVILYFFLARLNSRKFLDFPMVRLYKQVKFNVS